MSFSTFVTDKAGLQQFYASIVEKHETYAPVEKFGNFDFVRVTSLSECDPASPIERTRSIKPLFFPRSAKIMKYVATSAGTEVSETDEDPYAGMRVILGAKHCDARGLQVLDKVYNWDYIDTDYQKRRRNTVIVSARCDKAAAHCFCTSLDYNVENLDAMDVLVVNGPDGKIYLKARTEKGENLLKSDVARHATSVADEASAPALKQQYEAFASSFRLKMNYTEVNGKLSNIFDSPEFEKVSDHCVGCNTCAFVCPTCHCFKISDEKLKDTGVRYKSYDSCNNGYFTLMAGGHNPRPAKYRRWRQRALHKFVYYKERFGDNLCVGCGKCTVACPVNISIFEVANQVASTAM
ncbi:MAG TPA: 4Fe-4S dicluster domain-containing protein [Bacteroidales bacterium]|nr:4Fe-4S dicluster domain-containing protein [Bacteroidales bacterium]HPS61476.1 4Fe-4S dicluster domain-containing protein [Bacteroidales bacterium]